MKNKLLPIKYFETRRNYLLFTNDTGVSNMASRGGVYEHYIFDYIRDNLNVEGTTIIDIGANFGFHSLEFAELVGDTGRVEAFEPQRVVFYQLCGNAIANGFDNIYAHNLALGDSETTVLIETPQYYKDDKINIGNAHINAYTGMGAHEVKQVRLDDLHFDNVSVIKIDVQGFEPYVLDGAIKTIEKHRPHIFIEVEEPQLQIYGFTKESIFTRLADLGYTFQKVLDHDHLVDYVAIPTIAKPEYQKVSCVMTTYRRFKCVERSIGMFLAQDYPGETELIILNTDPDYPLILGESLKYENIKIINQHLDSQTGAAYTNVGAIRRDAVSFATGDLYICWDDDDIFLPWNIRQCFDAKKRLSKKAWKPSRSFFKTSQKLELVQNILEASILVDLAEVTNTGFRLETGSEHLGWYTRLRDSQQLDENDHYCVPGYCFNWGDPSDWGGHKQSGSINDPDNFDNHKSQTGDYAQRPLERMEYSDLLTWYSEYYSFLMTNRQQFAPELWDKYLDQYVK